MLDLLKVSGLEDPVVVITVGKPGVEFYFFIPNFEDATNFLETYTDQFIMNLSKQWYYFIPKPIIDSFMDLKASVYLKLIEGDFEVRYAKIPNAFFHPVFFVETKYPHQYKRYLDYHFLKRIHYELMRDHQFGNLVEMDSITVGMLIESELKTS